jgi:hypothetical protein
MAPNKIKTTLLSWMNSFPSARLALLSPFPRFEFVQIRRQIQNHASDSASDIETTLGFYVETAESESRDALDKLRALMG